MTKRTRENLKLTVILAVTLVLAILAVQTVYVGLGLSLLSCEVAEAEVSVDNNPYMRIEANDTYENVNLARAKFYNSSNPFISWLANMNNNLVRLPLGMLIIASPFLFIWAVRQYHLSKIKRARGN